MSEEEYALLKKIVQHQICSEDINLSVLRNVASQLDLVGTPTSLAILTQDTEQPPVRESQVTRRTDLVEENVVTEEIKNLHADLGCMMVDSSGEYRRSRSGHPSRYIADTYRICWSRFRHQFQCSCSTPRSRRLRDKA